METGELILIGLVVGGGAYLLLRKSTTPPPPAKPCAVSYQGVALSCAAIADAGKAIVAGVGDATKVVSQGFDFFGSGSKPTPAQLQAAVTRANAAGIVYSPAGENGWRGTTTVVKLQPGYLNYVTADGTGVYQGPSATGGKWIAPPAPRTVYA